MTYILVILVYAGILSGGDSVALTTVPGFLSQQECDAAGQATKTLTTSSVKELRYVCVARAGGK